MSASPRPDKTGNGEAPLATKPARPKKRPDFIGRLKRIYGDQVLSGNIVVADRESRPY